jgi:predicted small lipoprotein YifL
MRISTLLVLATLTLSLSLTACGRRGELYLPDSATPVGNVIPVGSGFVKLG